MAAVAGCAVHPAKASPHRSYSGITPAGTERHPWRGRKTLEETMPLKMGFRAALAGVLIAMLGVPPSALRASGHQQEGPVKPNPAPSTTPVKPPTGQQQPAQAGQVQSQAPQTAISVQSNLVNIDAVVTDYDGNIIQGLQRQNFRVLDDGQPQQISNFAPSEAPITIVVLMEFSKLMGGYFGYKAKNWAYGFLGHLNKKDWVAFKTFDFHTNILVDFTQNKEEVGQAVAGLYFPDFSEANLFDALLETMQQLRDVKGKKSILVIATGFDTFSKHTLDQTLKSVKETDVTIFCVGMAEEIELYSNGSHIGYLQAKNQLNTFAEMTGGYAWFPRFEGEMPEIFNSVATFLRSQYTIGFSPSAGVDGKFHKLKVEALDNDGNPLTTPDKKGKPKKVNVYARQGYSSPKPGLSGN
jgi:VWFA-related protein